jgi:hypothetical protein
MDGKMPMTTRTDMQNPRGTDYEHWKQPPTSPQPPRECKHEKSYEKNGVRYCDDCMKAWEVSRPHPQAPEQKSPICENCGLDNAKCQMDMAGCLQAQNEAARTATLKVLDELQRWMRDDCKLVFKLFSSGKMFHVERYDEDKFNAELLYLKLESLRAAGEQE